MFENSFFAWLYRGHAIQSCASAHEERNATAASAEKVVSPTNSDAILNVFLVMLAEQRLRSFWNGP